jgi:uncharacterized protein
MVFTDQQIAFDNKINAATTLSCPFDDSAGMNFLQEFLQSINYGKYSTQRRPEAQAGKTRNLAKLSAESNAITWFEIPVSDIKRAKKFYETVLDIKLVTAKPEGGIEAMELFPRLPDMNMGRTDVVSGSLIKADRLHPAGDGILIYLNANPEIDKAISRIVPSGGKVILPKTKNPAGYVCIFEDTEGNKMGIYAGN